MTTVIHQGQSYRSFHTNQNFDYNYTSVDGKELDLRPGGDSKTLHNRLLRLVTTMARASNSIMQNRLPKWRDLDRNLRAYVNADVEEQKVESEDSRKPVRVVIPQSYAILETLLTYMTAAFFDDPIFRYEPKNSEDNVGAALLESVIHSQSVWYKWLLELHTMWRDSFTYGFGAIAMDWEVTYGKIIQRAKKDNFMQKVIQVLSNNRFGIESEEEVLYEGNKFVALDPYRCFIDPHIPIHRAQEGEFFGWLERTNLSSLLTAEKVDDRIFNTRYLKSPNQGTGTNWKSVYFNEVTKSDRSPITSESEYAQIDYTNTIDVIHMYVKIIPEDYGISDYEYPEIWLIDVAGDSIITRAEPLDRNHNKFPVAISAPDYDGHGTAPVSKLEIGYEMQKVVDWMFRTYTAFARKQLHDRFLVNPYYVNLNDFADPTKGIIPLNVIAWQLPGAFDLAVRQLDTSNRSQDQILYAQVVSEMLDRFTGAGENLQGVRRKTSERVSATEFRGLQMAGLSRIEKAAMITSIMAHGDLAYMSASNTQQLMEEDTFVKITGSHRAQLAAEYGNNYQRVTPDSINIPYDVIPKDGSVPSGEFADVWVQILQILSTNPQFGRMFDLQRVFLHMAKISGAKSIHEFLNKGGGVNPEIKTDEEIRELEAAGNIIPALTAQPNGDSGNGTQF